jgi:syndecan 4
MDVIADNANCPWKCNTGYEKNGAGTDCKYCDAGKYYISITESTGICSECSGYAPEHGRFVSTLTGCEWVCDSGYKAASGACVICPANTYSTILPTTVVPVTTCTACVNIGSLRSNARYTLGQTTNVCQSQECRPGYKGTYTACTACTAGTWSAGGAASCTSCTQKPVNSIWRYAVGGTDTARNCEFDCNAGYTGAGCSACPSGTYKSTVGSDACTACTLPDTANGIWDETVTGATSSAGCAWLCTNGRYRYGNTCTACALGKWAGTGTTGSTSCQWCSNTSPPVDASSYNLTLFPMEYDLQNFTLHNFTLHNFTLQNFTLQYPTLITPPPP